MEVRQIPSGQIVANPNQPRKLFDPEALQELADSIAEHGLLQPIVVRPVFVWQCGHEVGPSDQEELDLWMTLLGRAWRSSAGQPGSSMERERSGLAKTDTASKSVNRKRMVAEPSWNGSAISGALDTSIGNAQEASTLGERGCTSGKSMLAGPFDTSPLPCCPICMSNGTRLSQCLKNLMEPVMDLPAGRPVRSRTLTNIGARRMPSLAPPLVDQSEAFGQPVNPQVDSRSEGIFLGAGPSRMTNGSSPSCPIIVAKRLLPSSASLQPQSGNELGSLVCELPQSLAIIVAGERRWRASQMVGLSQLPCVILPFLADAEAFILATTENVVRRDMTVIEEAKAYEQIIGLGRSIDQVAKLFGKSRLHIQNYVSLLSLREDFQHLLARKQLGYTVALSMAKLTIDGQAEVVRKLDQFPTEPDAVRYANAVMLRESQPALFGPLFGEPLSEEEQVRRRHNRVVVDNVFDRLAALAEALEPLMDLEAEDIVSVYGAKTEHAEAQMVKVFIAVHRAQARVKDAHALYKAGQEE